MLNFSVKKMDFLNPLSKVQTIVDKKSTMAIINNVLIYTNETYLFIEATDLEVSYRNKIPCSITEQGAMTINARKLYEIVKEFPSENINFKEEKNSWLKIGSAKKAEYRIGGLPPDDFPKFREINSENFIKLKTSTIKEMIEKTLFSASFDNSKFSLASICLEEEIKEEGTQIRMVSSDGHRLALMEKIISEKGLKIESSVIIPRKGAQEIKKLIEGYETLIFGIDDKFCFVICGDDYLVIRLIDGKFPDYHSIIPEEENRYFIFDRIEVFGALKRISIFSSDTTFRGVKINIEQNLMKIESLYKDIGEAMEIIDINYRGEPFNIAINGKYLMDALSVMESDKIKFIVNNTKSPCILKGENDVGFLGAIMPMNFVRQ